ncbi:MAG: Na+/H+ antiporter NhaA [Flavobacteriaceae bacterium]
MLGLPCHFIGSLAFANNPIYIDSAKIGILIGSLISAVTGFVILRSGAETMWILHI